MAILNHRLSGVPFKPSPNVGGALTPKFLILHYTAGRTAEGAIRTLSNPAAKVSAHLVVGQDGTTVQLVPFNRIAWHAGTSEWKGLKSLNRYSIGIEFVNPGFTKRVNGVWKSPHLGTVYPDSEIIEARHKFGGALLGWKKFPEAQIQRGLEIVQEIVARYPNITILGHDDIAPGRKKDPGPAFPMELFQEPF